MEQEKLDTLFKLLAQTLKSAEESNAILSPNVRSIKHWMLENAPEYVSNDN
jgi:hypothetical protein